ncbi:MAG: penicillin-binding protein 2 [Methylotenera sp.]|nr:penicillin-binding protein 2 [Methylotenera sp.]MDO9233951.1 penicillin-binding protein 2 [Methylotenera sp.]MDO9388881.1 penicillin-binding protein 2 [Methylotenera sp.]MDP2102676.1 penicillin-binding protein 2 [Methylotenera sp.]MDP2282316.1 penicillin-binding protein 2 [Methylotenera sp.]
MGAELRNYLHEQYYFRLRLGFTALVVISLFALLASRFYYLQVKQYNHYQTLAENNRISLIPIAPNRGLILDKNGVVLAHNFFVYTLEITPAKIKDLEATIAEISQFVEISPLDRKRFNRLRQESRNFESVPIRTHLNEVEAAKFAVNHFRFPGVEIKSRLFRHYPLGKLGSHMVGYIGRINDKDLADLEKSGDLSNYKGSDHIGKSGLEQFYERQLHGTTGFQQVEVDADGHAVRVLSSNAPIPGDNLILSADSKLQEIAETAFGDRRGALVAINPKTGEVLSYVSQPTFDPNLFVGGIDTENWKLLNDSLDKPLINRPLRGIYPPGSTFKPFVALAGLEAGKRMPPFSIHDAGYFSFPNSRHRYRDWKPSGHGIVDMQRAITISCDTFFYGLAMELGIEKLTSFVRHFGFGRKSDFDLKGEIEGLLPTPEWKMRRFKQPWYPGETVIVGIGQGYTLVTPLQLAQATSILANNGVAMKPHLVAQIQNSLTGKRHISPPVVQDKITLNPDNMDIVRRGMVDVTLPGGTAASIGANAGYSIAAKTGTAQVIGIKQNEKYNEHTINERHRDHALFIAFAPAEDPKIALAVIVENGGHGGSAAGPIARKVMDYYLLGKLPIAEAAKIEVKIPINATGNAPATTPRLVPEEELYD